MLTNNINYLRKKYPYIREDLKVLEPSEKFIISEAKSGDKTLSYIKDSKEIYFHSKYNPVREAEALIENYKDIENENIIFYGTGLGYHIDMLMALSPKNDYYIFEPISEILEEFLSNIDLTKTKYKNLKVLSMSMENITKDINDLVGVSKKKINIIELPTHKQVFEKEFDEFNESFLKIINQKRKNLLVDYSFQRKWIVNSMKNFKEVLSTPNILLNKNKKLVDKPILLISAGPSLSEEIENIRYVKQNRLAYIVSVGSAINALIKNNILPDAVTTYDPTEKNQDVFAKVREENIKNVPMIFGSSVNHGTLSSYPGEKYHMITSQDKVSNYFLEGDDEIEIVLDAPSIAVVTLQLLLSLGCSPIVLVGQNLAYLDNNIYSKDIQYNKRVSEEELKNSFKVKSVDGNEVITNEGYNNMRLQLESYISQVEKGRVINTTKNGAEIKGTEFKELQEIISDNLKNTVVDDKWLKMSEYGYNKKLLKLKLNDMDYSLLTSKSYMEKYEHNLKELFSLVETRQFNQLNNTYNKLNRNIEKLETNHFFTTFILQINRVEHRLLAYEIKASKNEKNIYNKNINLLKAYRKFINKCRQDIDSITPIYEDMRTDILYYINE